ncbi:MAG: glycosyl transferase [Desulfobulbus propionicus]|nr:MAG: glycosyl transferase [Desulfobulbus propionicus]
MTASKPHLRILGTRGVPAQHGGFETFAEQCALYLSRHGWNVTVYCQEHGEGPIQEDEWQGVRRVLVPVRRRGSLSTMIFDWLAIAHACQEEGVILCLGYNTALFNLRLRLKGIPTIMNMDGIEWRRDKWHWAAKCWFYINEKAGMRLSDHLIADNPGIARHLEKQGARTPLTTIAYGAACLENISPEPLARFGLKENGYLLIIARPEPENSILKMVRAFCSKMRNYRLVILGDYSSEHPYQRKVKEAANEQVLFCGALYDREVVDALRYHCRLYLHGHTVGGTNPSLVEAMGAANAVIAHDNVFNRWVTGPEAACFFSSEAECLQRIDALLEDQKSILQMKDASRKRFREVFTWDKVLAKYQSCLEAYLS